MKLITLIEYDLKNYFHSKIGFFTMLILPILAIISAVQISTALLVSHSFMDPITLIIVDREQSFYTNFFIQKIIETPSLQENIEIVQTSEEEGHRLLDENKAGGMVIIPEKFTSNMQESIFEPIIVIGNHRKPLEATIIKEGMESATNLMSAAQSAVFTICDYARENQLPSDEIDAIFQKSALSFSLKALSRGKIFSQKLKTPWMDMEPVYFYFSSILILFISLYGLQGMYLYINERQSKITVRIRTLGIPLWKIILGKWLALTLFLFIHANIVLWICKAIKLFEVSGHMRLATLFLLGICSCMSSLILLISTFSKSDYIGSMIIFSISILGIFLGGGIIPYAYMPSFMPLLGQLSIHYWAIQGLIYALFSDQTSKVWQSAGVLGILTGIFITCVFIKLLWEEKSYDVI